MPSAALESRAKAIGGEWERLILGVSALVMAVALALMVMHYLDAMNKADPPRTGNRNIASVFNPSAFAYLEEQNDFRLPGQHAFMVRPPNGFRPPRPERPERPERPTTTTQTNQTTQVKPPPVKPTPPDKVVDTVVKAPPPPPPPPPAKPQPPQIKHYVSYKGFMTLPSSDEPLALISYERERGKSVRRETEMVGAGNAMRGLSVQSFDDQKVVLQTKDGQSIVVQKGERLELPE